MPGDIKLQEGAGADLTTPPQTKQGQRKSPQKVTNYAHANAASWHQESDRATP